MDFGVIIVVKESLVVSVKDLSHFAKHYSIDVMASNQSFRDYYKQLFSQFLASLRTSKY